MPESVQWARVVAEAAQIRQEQVAQVKVSPVVQENQLVPMQPGAAVVQGASAVRAHKSIASIPVHGVARAVLASLRRSPARRLTTVVAVVAVSMA